MDIFVIFKMIWLMLPAYLANPAAAISAKIGGAGRAIDFGKSYKDKRIFGDGKTYKGLVSGIIFGIFVAVSQNIINIYLINSVMPAFNFTAILLLPSGAMLGDLVASFFKRRMGFKRGQAFPVLDQLDFVAGAWFLELLFNREWFLNNFSAGIIITAIILTPFFHLMFNIIGYKLRISKEPW